MANVGKEQFVRGLANKEGITIKKAQEVTNMVLEYIADTVGTLEDGEKLNLQGYLQFVVTDVEARKGHHPSTGEEIDIPATRRVRVKPMKAIKDAVVKP